MVVNFFWGLVCLQVVLTTTGHTEIVLHGTRVIYPSNAREITLQLSNNGTAPSLVQAWIDDGNAKSTPDETNVSFIITPPISRVEATKGANLKNYSFTYYISTKPTTRIYFLA